MRYGEFDDLFRTGLEGQAVLGRYDLFFLRLERDAADAVGVTGRRSRDGTFPAADEEISGGRAFVGSAAVITNTLVLKF